MFRIFAIALLCFSGSFAMNASFSETDNPEARGKQIYLHGSLPNRPAITATLGEDADPIPASAFPCVNCHGRDGKGKPEGGIIPSDIRWSTLTKPYELELASGRKRGPYTERSLKRAISMGIDSYNNKLNAGMPHFQMSQNDAADLIAYLKVLGVGNDPGVSDDHLRLGVILPPRRMTEMHDSVKSTLESYFSRINRQGGIFDRQIDEEFLDYPENPQMRKDTVRNFIRQKNIFALTSSFLAGDEAELGSVFQQEEIPALAAFALYPQTSSPNPFLFYLDEGISGQVKALVSFAAKRFRKDMGKLAVLYSDTMESRQLAGAIETQCRMVGIANPVRVPIQDRGMMSAAQAKELFTAGDTFIVLLAPLPLILRDLHRLGIAESRDSLLVPASLLPNRSIIRPGIRGMNIFVAYSGSVLSENQIPSLPSEQALALGGASIVVEALKRAGHDLDRQTFISALQGLSAFDNGFVAPVTFGPNQHVGNTRSQIMFFDTEKNKLMVLQDEH